MCGFRSPETRAQFGSVDLRFPGCCSQSLGGFTFPSVCAWEGTHFSSPWQFCALSSCCHFGSPLLWGCQSIQTLQVTSIETFLEIKMLNRNEIKFSGRELLVPSFL